MCERCDIAEVGFTHPEQTSVRVRERVDGQERAKLVTVDLTVVRARIERRGHCSTCGMKLGSTVRRMRRRKIGGKRGRNSGKVKSHSK